LFGVVEDVAAEFLNVFGDLFETCGFKDGFGFQSFPLAIREGVDEFVGYLAETAIVECFKKVGLWHG